MVPTTAIGWLLLFVAALVAGFGFAFGWFLLTRLFGGPTAANP